MPQNINHPLFLPVASAMREAGMTITEPMIKAGAGTLGITTKNDKSIVTLADKKTEDFLTQKLKELLPDSEVLGEETAGDDWRNSPLLKTDEYLWIIDPIDGTKPYSEGGEYGIMVGLRQHGDMEAAWIYYPRTDEMLFVSNKDAVHRIKWENSCVRIDAATMESQCELADMNIVHYCKKYQDFLGVYAPITRGFASHAPSVCIAIDVSHVISGKLANFCEGHFTPWDHYISRMIVEMAGGSACFIRDSAVDGDWPTGAIMAPSKQVMLFILNEAQKINPRLRIVA